MNQLQAAVTEFQISQHRYPHTVDELAASAADTKPLDLTALGKVTFTSYKDGAFAISAGGTSPEDSVRTVVYAVPSHT